MNTDNGDLRNLINELVVCLHTPPCSNKRVTTKVLMASLRFSRKHLKILLTTLAHTTIDLENLRMTTHWMEDPTSGMRYIPSQVLGFVSSRTTAKQLGNGSAEWSRSDVKMIQDGKQSNLGGKSLKMRAIFTHQQSLMMPVFWGLISRITMMLMYLETMIYSEFQILLCFHFTSKSFIFRFYLWLEEGE